MYFHHIRSVLGLSSPPVQQYRLPTVDREAKTMLSLTLIYPQALLYSKPLLTSNSPPSRQRHVTRVNALPPAKREADDPRSTQDKPQAYEV